MCLGLPLQVREVLSDSVSVCLADGMRREINTGLLDRPPRAGDWILVHVDIAIRALTPQEAQQIGDALRAVTAAAQGEAFEHLIADLIDHEPELPAHLRDNASNVNHIQSTPKRIETTEKALTQTEK